MTKSSTKTDKNPDDINSLQELADLWDLKVSEYNFLFLEKNPKNKKRLEELNELLDNIKAREKLVRKMQREEEKNKKKMKEKEDERKRHERDEKILEDIKNQEKHKTSRKRELSELIDNTNKIYKEKNALLDKYSNELGIPLLENELKRYKSELEKVEKKNVCPHPYKDETFDKIYYKGESCTWVESHGFDRTYGHRCPLCGEKMFF